MSEGGGLILMYHCKYELQLPPFDPIQISKISIMVSREGSFIRVFKLFTCEFKIQLFSLCFTLYQTPQGQFITQTVFHYVSINTATLVVYGSEFIDLTYRYVTDFSLRIRIRKVQLAHYCQSPLVIISLANLSDIQRNIQTYSP